MILIALIIIGCALLAYVPLTLIFIRSHKPQIPHAEPGWEYARGEVDLEKHEKAVAAYYKELDL